MVKQLALLVLSLSATTYSLCQAAERFLTFDEVRNADTVSAWLNTHDSASSQDDVRFLLNLAEQSNQHSNWSAAAKAYGEAMIRYPSPQAVGGHADALIRMLGYVRAREKSFDTRALQDVQRTLDYYRSAMAANSVLKTLDEQGADDLQSKIDCLAGFIADGDRTAQCEPLRAYFDAPEP